MSVQALVRQADHSMPDCRLYLVRHGTTVMNVQNRYRGRRDIPLDAQGYQDAVDAARRLSSVGVAAVYTGPLRRTIATAQIIADAAGVPDLRILHGLNNLDYGIWEGMTADEAASYEPEAHALYRTSPMEAVCPQGERLVDAQRRMVAALQLIGSRHPGEAVVAVTHAVMIRLTHVALNGVEGENWRRPVGRGSVTEFRIGDTIRLAGTGDESMSAAPSSVGRVAVRSESPVATMETATS
jgi:broad specificity phosphatase PhoE